MMFRPLTVAVPCAGCWVIARLVIGPVSAGITPGIVTGLFAPVFAVWLTTIGVGWSTAMVYACVPWKLNLSVAVTVMLNGPAAVGVPEITPAGLSVRPAGNAPAVTA